MNITATQLQKKGNTGQIREEVDNILKSLESVIITAHEQRSSSITHEIPFNFAISNMQLKDAQLIIYSSVINALEKRGFIVKIKFTATATFIRVGWPSVFDKEEIERMNEVIKSHLLPNT
jgi:hypothetical protein